MRPPDTGQQLTAYYTRSPTTKPYVVHAHSGQLRVTRRAAPEAIPRESSSAGAVPDARATRGRGTISTAQRWVQPH